MAGSSKELLEAVQINPNNRNEIADALLEALEMPEEEQIMRNTVMQERLQRYDIIRWANDFIEELFNAKRKNRRYYAKVLSPNARKQLIECYQASERRLMLLDYDGTLVPFATLPHNAVPDQRLREVLQGLSEETRNEIVIISGRDRAFLERWFSDVKISLVAEHGVWIKEKGGEWQMAINAASEWKPKLKPFFERYVDRVAGSFVEEKDFALVWHYRGAEPEPGKLAAQELRDHLLAFVANIDVHILQGNKTVEARVAGANKGSAGSRFLSRNLYDFILCIGDDVTDEELFAVLPDDACSIRVGVGMTCARHTLTDVQEVMRLLGEFTLPCA